MSIERTSDQGTLARTRIATPGALLTRMRDTSSLFLQKFRVATRRWSFNTRSACRWYSGCRRSMQRFESGAMAFSYHARLKSPQLLLRECSVSIAQLDQKTRKITLIVGSAFRRVRRRMHLWEGFSKDPAESHGLNEYRAPLSFFNASKSCFDGSRSRPRSSSCSFHLTYTRSSRC